MDAELVVRPADPRLRGRVERCWGYSYRSGVPTRQRELLSAHVVLIVGLGPELRLVDGGGARPLDAFVAGLDDACAVIEHDGEMRGLQIDLAPAAARMIFGVPMHELARRVVTLEDALGPSTHLLVERLAEAPGWEQRFRLVETALAARLDAAEPPPADVDWAWRRLVRSQGRIAVGDLAREIGCSRKHLAARFRDHVGLPPKLVARMLRFRRAAEVLLDSPEASLARVAASCGYYDHAHLDRDFRDFAGTTPTAYLTDPQGRVTFVQDAAATAA